MLTRGGLSFTNGLQTLPSYIRDQSRKRIKKKVKSISRGESHWGMTHALRRQLIEGRNDGKENLPSKNRNAVRAGKGYYKLGGLLTRRKDYFMPVPSGKIL